jgi:mannose-6-phosphate isomerase-like protein (cupin superfamily)
MVKMYKREIGMSLGWVDNIEERTTKNDTFRTTLFTGQYSQLTVMSIKVGEEIGNEVHEDNDQFIRIEQGTARVTFGVTADKVDEEHVVKDDWAVIIPAGTWHNVINAGEDELKLYSVYSPAEHPAGTVHQTKAEADAAEAAEHSN